MTLGELTVMRIWVNAIVKFHICPPLLLLYPWLHLGCHEHIRRLLHVSAATCKLLLSAFLSPSFTHFNKVETAHWFFHCGWTVGVLQRFVSASRVHCLCDHWFLPADRPWVRENARILPTANDEHEGVSTTATKEESNMHLVHSWCSSCWAKMKPIVYPKEFLITVIPKLQRQNISLSKCNALCTHMHTRVTEWGVLCRWLCYSYFGRSLCLLCLLLCRTSFYTMTHIHRADTQPTCNGNMVKDGNCHKEQDATMCTIGLSICCANPISFDLSKSSPFVSSCL